jgi:acetolactate synthase-1/3 small subunit
MPVAKHTLVALVEDKPGVLNRMASVFRRRGYNIESINVLETINADSDELPNLSRVAIVVGGSTATLERLRRHLENIVDVVKVADITTKGVA